MKTHVKQDPNASGVNEETGAAYGPGTAAQGSSTLGKTGAEVASQAAANSLSSNMGANLKTSNTPQVIPGGVSNAVASSMSKKRKGGGLSNQLGINV